MMEIGGPTPNLTGTVAFRYDRSPLRCAINDYDGHRREIWRITLEGKTPEAG